MKFFKILFVIFIPLSSCIIVQTTIPPVQDFLPRDTDVPGWIKNNSYHSILPNKISEINNLYSIYKVTEFTSANYQSLSEGKGEMRIVLVKSNSPLNAFGLFSIDRKNESFRHQKEFSFFSDNGYFFLMGEYYIKLQCNNNKDLLKEDIEMFEGVFKEGITEYATKEKLPPIFYNLSDKKSLEDLTFYRIGLPQLPGSRDLFVRSMKISGNDVSVFYMKSDTAYNALRHYLEILELSKNYIVSRVGNTQMAFRKEDKNKYQFITTQREWIVGILNSKSIDSGKKILITIVNKMP